MQTFHDYDIKNPFDVTAESQTITDGKVTLNYTPLQGSVTITGFTENTSGTPAKGEFYIDYAVNSQYRMATQVVKFNTEDNGTTVSVTYKGVSTIIFARHMNEIKEFIESVPGTYATSTGLNNESTARTSADSALDTRVTAVENKKPMLQVTKMDAVAGKVLQIPIENTTTFCKPAVEVLKFKAGTTNTLITECGFDNSNASDFTYDSKYVAFDGTMHPVTSYAVTMSTPVALGNGYLSTSDELDVSQWQTVESIGVATTGEATITGIALVATGGGAGTWTTYEGAQS